MLLLLSQNTMGFQRSAAKAELKIPFQKYQEHITLLRLNYLGLKKLQYHQNIYLFKGKNNLQNALTKNEKRNKPKNQKNPQLHVYLSKKSKSQTEANQGEVKPRILLHPHHQLHSSVRKLIRTWGGNQVTMPGTYF